MKNQIKNIALVLLTSITFFSCTTDNEEIEMAKIENVAPINGKAFSADEASQPITFRWTPIVPKPNQSVTYRLKVWQLMQGQNSTEAMRTNQPIVTKDVMDITEISVPGIYTGPCRPPYLCDFVWTVEAIAIQNGSAQGEIIATSNPTVFNF